MDLRNFFTELKRRRVYSVAAAYVVASWLLIQIATQVFPFFAIPDWVVRLIILLLIVGFPVAVVSAWAFELTPEGIQREENIDRQRVATCQTRRKLTALVVALAALAAGLFVFRLVRSQQSSET
ncbi:MAG: hypothetical protein ABI233_08215 [Chthoniobacterales bacterium]